MQAQGDGGELRAGGRVAARIGRWQMDQGAGTRHVITAAVQPIDAFWITQPPFDLYLTMGGRFWFWHVLEMNGNAMQVDGYPEVK